MEIAQVYNDAYQYYINQADNIEIGKIFHDWWHGECIYTEDYRAKYSEEDHYEANSLILAAISRGFG